MTDFLADDVDKLVKPGNYMKFEQGDNKFRPLDSMITGWVGWKKGADGTNRPVRFRVDQSIPMNTVDDTDSIRPFYAFPVWNYKQEAVQILEITQKGIQKIIKGLARNKDWGSPVGVDGYDITVTREGEGLDTEYSVAPSPHKKLDPGIMQLYKDMHINMQALYTGDDPFNSSEDTLVDDAAKALS